MIQRLRCWLTGHSPRDDFTIEDNVVLRDGWGNAVVIVSICARCDAPYLQRPTLLPPETP